MRGKLVSNFEIPEVEIHLGLDFLSVFDLEIFYVWVLHISYFIVQRLDVNLKFLAYSKVNFKPKLSLRHCFSLFLQKWTKVQLSKMKGLPAQGLNENFYPREQAK